MAVDTSVDIVPRGHRWARCPARGRLTPMAAAQRNRLYLNKTGIDWVDDVPRRREELVGLVREVLAAPRAR
jgi:hypothetical protein